ncbi:MAG TPA: RodZ domain-containing protein, partial [Gaiellaceae bacterium]|nr:RodZ domain-containing protein [Gaiellaceae bacterium]
GSLYVEEYNSRFAHPDEQPQLVPERFERTGPRLGVGLLRPLVAIGIIVAVVGVAAWQLSGSSGGKQGGGAPPATTTTTTPTTTAAHTPPTKKPHKHVVVALPSRAVVVASRGNSWLWVRSRSATGPTVYEGTLLQGKTLPVNLANGPVWIRIGAPTVDIRLGGKLVRGLPTQVGNVLLTRRGIQPA